MKENKYKKYIYLTEYHIGNGIDFIRYKLLPLIIKQKILSSIIGAIILITGTTLIITLSENKEKSQIQLSSNPRKTQNTLPITSNQASKEAGINPSSQNNNTNQQPAISQPAKSSPGIPTSQNIQISRGNQAITPTKAQSKPSSGGSQLIRTLAQGATGTGGTQGNQGSQATQPPSTPTPTQGISNNPPQIIFIGPGGQQQIYTPPSTPPVEVTWTRYANIQDHYSIEYPSNWQIITEEKGGHEQVIIYMPGADPDDPNAQYIKFGMSNSFTPPQASYSGPFVLYGVHGTLYTNGSAGTSYIAAALKYTNGYLVLNNSISETILLYVFNHMLYSIELDPS